MKTYCTITVPITHIQKDFVRGLATTETKAAEAAMRDALQHFMNDNDAGKINGK